MCNLKYNVGDVVRIKSIEWYLKNRDSFGRIYFTIEVKPWYRFQDSTITFFKDMALECGLAMTIEYIHEGVYIMKGSKYCWTDDMIEGLITNAI